jgi:hypothetical protein
MRAAFLLTVFGGALLALLWHVERFGAWLGISRNTRALLIVLEVLAIAYAVGFTAATLIQRYPFTL